MCFPQTELRQECLELFAVELDPVEPVVKILGCGSEIVRLEGRVERMASPQQSQQTVDRGWLVDPAARQAGRQINAAPRDGGKACPFGPCPSLPELRIDGDDRVE